jgi:hypothetical protein
MTWLTDWLEGPQQLPALADRPVARAVVGGRRVG